MAAIAAVIGCPRAIGLLHLSTLPFSDKSDQHQISPRNINTLYDRVVTRIKNMIKEDAFN